MPDMHGSTISGVFYNSESVYTFIKCIWNHIKKDVRAKHVTFLVMQYSQVNFERLHAKILLQHMDKIVLQEILVDALMESEGARRTVLVMQHSQVT